MLRGPFKGSSPSSLAKGLPGVKKPMSLTYFAGSGPTIAVMKSSWLIACRKARRIAGLSKGGWRWLKRNCPGSGSGSIGSSSRPRLRPSSVWISAGICSSQSTSPAVNAAAAVPASGMMVHSTRSKCTTLGPAVRPLPPPGRGT